MISNRIKNSRRNVLGAIVNKGIAIVFPFVIRTVLIYKLGSEYVGLNSLFTSILQILSLTELGLGSAITYSMYKPIDDGDIGTVCAILNLYKKLYRFIGIAILAIGCILIPFLPFLISGDVPTDINLYVLYVIYLVNTSISYFLFAYKSSILNAYQRSDIESYIITIVNVAMYAIQISVLFAFSNYYIYIIFLPLSTILINIIRSLVVKKKYPEIIAYGEVSSDLKKDIYSRVGALIGHQLSGTVNCSLDNIVISAFLGLLMVARYGNYYYVVSALAGILQVVFASFTPSIGNSLLSNDNERIEKNFYDLFYINMWIVVWICVCMACLYQPFILLWVGDDNLFPIQLMLIFVLYFFSWQSRRTVIAYKNAAGMWKDDFWKPYVSVFLNLILNFVLVQFIGLYGVMLSTVFVYLFIEGPWETIVFFKKRMNKKPVVYYAKLIAFTILGLAIGTGSFFLCNLLPFVGLGNLAIRAAFLLFVPNFLWVASTFWTSGFKRSLTIIGLRKEQ